MKTILLRMEIVWKSFPTATARFAKSIAPLMQRIAQGVECASEIWIIIAVSWGICFFPVTSRQCVAKNNVFSFYLFLVCIFLLEALHYELDSSIFILKFTPVSYFYRILSRWLQQLFPVCNKHSTPPVMAFSAPYQR